MESLPCVKGECAKGFMPFAPGGYRVSGSVDFAKQKTGGLFQNGSNFKLKDNPSVGDKRRQLPLHKGALPQKLIALYIMPKSFFFC